MIVFGDRESEESLAVRARGGEQATQSLTSFSPRCRRSLKALVSALLRLSSARPRGDSRLF